MVLPLVAGAGLLFGGALLGKSAGGGAIEIGTSKKSYQTTTSNQTTTSSVYSPTTSRNYDIQYNIAGGGSSISTKKEQSVSQVPTVSPVISPQLTSTPITSQGGGTGTGSDKTDFTGIALIGAVGLGAYLLLNGGKKK